MGCDIHCAGRKIFSWHYLTCLFLCVYLLYWVHREKSESRSSWNSISYHFFQKLSHLISEPFCLNYWFAEKATRVHCSMRQSQTVVYNCSALFLSTHFLFCFFDQGQTTFRSPGGRRVWSGKDWQTSFGSLNLNPLEIWFCLLVYLHTKVCFMFQNTILGCFFFYIFDISKMCLCFRGCHLTRVFDRQRAIYRLCVQSDWFPDMLHHVFMKHLTMS